LYGIGLAGSVVFFLLDFLESGLVDFDFLSAGLVDLAAGFAGLFVEGLVAGLVEFLLPRFLLPSGDGQS
jgi:hypothetical protein